MTSPWKVTSNPIGDRIMYAVYRVIDVNAVDHSGNREFATDFMEDQMDALVIAQDLNEMEEKLNGEEDRG